ncbi:MAG TPA: hypothetical protein DSN98_05980 [Thermoplasmata archaeon]|jgi:hypothetical protein|nr:MAG TPA: hypothetical protein DSN98_05980 [Thermoplasmata archaeon]
MKMKAFLIKGICFGIISILTLLNSAAFVQPQKIISDKKDIIEEKNMLITMTPTISYIPSSNGLPTEGQWKYDTRIGDVNNDGHLDIIRLRGHDDFNPPDKGFQIWLGDGTGNWNKTAIPNGDFGYGGTAIGDFNNDGYLDAAYGVHHNEDHPLIGAWLGNGGISFTEHSSGLATDGETWGMAPLDFADFNNDGWLDLGVGSFGCCNGIRVYESINGGENWVSRSTGLPHNDESPNAGDRFVWEDINRDGFLDVLMFMQMSISGEEHLIWLGDGAGNWTTNDFGLPFTFLWGPYGLDTGDVNNDGWSDIMFIKTLGSAEVPVVYLFNGTGWIEASIGLPNTQTFGPLAFGDLNNDGNLDLVGLEGYLMGSWPNEAEYTDVHIWLGDGTGQWTQLDEIATEIPGWPESVTLADIDHNNYLDIIISSDQDDYEPGGIRVYKNTNPADQLGITMRQPLGGQVFRKGGIQKIYWTSSIPSGTGTVSLQYSLTGNQGPWYPIVENITDANYYQWTVPNVNSNTVYIKATLYWNEESASTVSLKPFTIIGQNTPPNIPVFIGPTSGKPNEQYEYTINAIDPDGDMISYLIDWGDGSTSGWVGPFPSGSPVTLNHSWETPKTYLVKGKAKDANEVESSWSATLLVNISISSIDISIKGGLGISIVLKNTGNEDLIHIPWSVTLDGGLIIIGKTNSGILAQLKEGEQKTIQIKILGFGSPIISIRVQDTLKNATGMVFFFFIFGVK